MELVGFVLLGIAGGIVPLDIVLVDIVPWVIVLADTVPVAIDLTGTVLVEIVSVGTALLDIALSEDSVVAVVSIDPAQDIAADDIAAG